MKKFSKGTVSKPNNGEKCLVTCWDQNVYEHVNPSNEISGGFFLEYASHKSAEIEFRLAIGIPPTTDSEISAPFQAPNDGQKAKLTKYEWKT